MPLKPKPIRILIVAGEVSGDLLGAELMKAMKKQRPGLSFYGVGGAAMKKAGLHELGDMNIFPGMFLAFIPALPKILGLLADLTDWAKAHQPHLCITIDNQEFSAHLAKRLARQGVPCVQYVAPKVWAWRQGRVRKLRRIFTHMLCLFPFEADFFKLNKLPATYVGHPVIDRMKPYAKQAATPSLQKPTLLICPGSRRSELTRHWPLFLATFKALKKEFPKLKGRVALMDQRALRFCREHGWDSALSPAIGTARFAAMAGSTAALTKSGTNNLELALLGVPAVVVYKTSAVGMWLARRLVRVPYVSPPNLIVGGDVYPEFLQEQATIEALTGAIKVQLRSKDVREATMKVLQKVQKRLHTVHSAPVLAAQAVLKYIP